MGSLGKQEFGRLLQQARESVPISREELAQKVGLDPSYIWRLEERSERRPSPETALALADALRVPDEKLNEWLVAAGHEPLPFVTSLRSTVRKSGIARRKLSSKESAQIESESGIRAKRLRQLGFTNLVVDRLLSALSNAPLDVQANLTDAVSRGLETVIHELECPVETAVIPVAGGQHRFFAPSVIQRLLLGVIREAADAGIRNVVVVIAPGMDQMLVEPIKAALDLSVIPSIALRSIEQPSPSGLGDAILRTRSNVGLKPFAVLLPDDIVEPKHRKAPRLERLTSLLSKVPNGSFVAIAPVQKSQMPRCGVIERDHSVPDKGLGYSRINRLVEKPDRRDPICDSENVFGIVGRYVLQPTIFEELSRIRAEIPHGLELTDALEGLRTKGELIYSVEFSGGRTDIGDIFSRTSEFGV